MCASFIDYIAQAEREILVSSVAKAKFFLASKLMVALIQVMLKMKCFWLTTLILMPQMGRSMCVTSFFALRQPKCSNAEGCMTP